MKISARTGERAGSGHDQATLIGSGCSTPAAAVDEGATLFLSAVPFSLQLVRLGVITVSGADLQHPLYRRLVLFQPLRLVIGRVRATDRRGNAASFTYDARYNMLTKTDREGQLWRWIYNSDKPVTQIDPTGNRTIHSYNATWDLESTTVDPKTDPFDGTYSKPTGIALKTNFTYTATGEHTIVEDAPAEGHREAVLSPLQV